MPQVKILRNGVDILIATPGRLLDLIKQRHITLDRVEIFILDEAGKESSIERSPLVGLGKISISAW